MLCSSVWECCSGKRTGPIRSIFSREQREGQRRGPHVLLLASSDVVHAIRSPFVNVILIDVRKENLFRQSHVEGALNFPCGQRALEEEVETLLRDNATLQGVLDKVTPGALEQAFAEEKPTCMVGSCVIVYDSVGDSMDMVGPAAIFADLLASSGHVPELGRLAGGFQAFEALGDCVFTSSERQRPHAGDRKSSTASRPDSGCSFLSTNSSHMSQALTPRERRSADPILWSLPETQGGGGRATPKWKVTIESPAEVQPAEVIPGRLFLGSKTHAGNWDTLRRLRITHIINVSRDGGTPFAREIEYCVCHVADTVSADVAQFFRRACDFIEAAMRSSERNVVLVHCAGGISRSSAVVCAYMMRSERLSLAGALQYVRERHPAAAPNSGFIHQLMAWERRIGVSPGPMLGPHDLHAAGNSSSPDTCTSASEDTNTSLSAAPASNTQQHLDHLSWADYAAAPPTPQTMRAEDERKSRPWAVTPKRSSQAEQWGATGWADGKSPGFARRGSGAKGWSKDGQDLGGRFSDVITLSNPPAKGAKGQDKPPQRTSGKVAANKRMW